MAAAARKQQHITVDTPAWMDRLVETYVSGIASNFIVTGNVLDYVHPVLPGQYIKEALIDRFKSRDVIVSWNSADGFQFPTTEMAKRFVSLVDFPLPGQNNGANTPASSRLGALQSASGTPNIDVEKILERVQDPLVALGFLNRLLKSRANKVGPDNRAVLGPDGKPEQMRYCILIDYAEVIAPAIDNGHAQDAQLKMKVILSQWGRDLSIGDRGHVIFLISNNAEDINDDLKAVRWEPVEVPYPDQEIRGKFFQFLVDSDRSQLAPGLTVAQAARATTGMRIIDCEDISLRASNKGLPIDLTLIKERKDQIIESEYASVITIGEPQVGFEAVGGIDYLIDDFQATIIEPMREGRYDEATQGLLLMGPAGTGKTLIATALAKESGATFVKMQFDKIITKWLGDSERKFRQALDIITTMTPCIVFIDEIDQTLRRGEEGSNEATSRMFNMLLQAMADPRWKGKLLWVAATNRPDLLDAALLRPGRMSKKVPILAPDSSQRAEILGKLTPRFFKSGLPTAEEYQALALQMTGYTGAEIEQVLTKAAQLKARYKAWTVIKCLQEAFERIMPTTANVEEMSRLALLNCDDLDLVPETYRKQARALRHPASKVEQVEEAQEEPKVYERGVRAL